MNARVFLVVVDESPEFAVALRYACHRAKAVAGRVAMLSIVEPEGIETWGGVEKALDDEAFARARKLVASHEKTVLDVAGQPPLLHFKKGEKKAVLIDLIEAEKDISVLVMGASSREAGRNPLIQYLTSDKGLRKLKIPFIIVPEGVREDALIDG